jgi:hypothetical protein
VSRVTGSWISGGFCGGIQRDLAGGSPGGRTRRLDFCDLSRTGRRTLLHEPAEHHPRGAHHLVEELDGRPAATVRGDGRVLARSGRGGAVEHSDN